MESPTVILISANIEWRAIREIFPDAEYQKSPYGQWFTAQIEPEINAITPSTKDINTTNVQNLVFFHGGWGKIAAAGSTQYVIDRWRPDQIINLGTCGGFEGRIDRGEVILAERTIVYDIIEQMGDQQAHIEHYTTDIDLSWLSEPYPIKVNKNLLVSADKDLLIDEISDLIKTYGAVAGDWESGAIAWVANQNNVRLLILRGVSDLVGATGGEAYGNIDLFARSASEILKNLVLSLPGWLTFV